MKKLLMLMLCVMLAIPGINVAAAENDTKITEEQKSFDEILIYTGLTTEELLVRLTEMELSGLIEQVEGDRYKR